MLFLENCLENSVAPRGIQRRFRKSKVYHSALIERAFVKDELAKSRTTLLKVRNHFQRAYRQARAFLGFYHFVRLSWLLSECDRRQRSSLSRKNQDSIGRLRRNRIGSHQGDYGTIYNFTDMELSTLQKEVLCLGVDFSVPPPNISEPDVLAEFKILQRQTAQLCPASKEA